MAKRNWFTRDEVVLCIYAARFGLEEIGGIDAIRSITGRSGASLQLKIQNLVAMCDEEHIPRNPNEAALTGLPAGQSGRRTHWQEMQEFMNVSRRDHLEQCRRILRHSTTLPGELGPEEHSRYIEGASRTVFVNSYERDRIARMRCIEHYGTSCVVCEFNFGATFGPDGEGFIHVHHLTPLADIRQEHDVDPIRDLRPVCPNCHAMIHLGDQNRTIDEMRQLLAKTNIHE